MSATAKQRRSADSGWQAGPSFVTVKCRFREGTVMSCRACDTGRNQSWPQHRAHIRLPDLENIAVQVAITCRHGNIPQETHEYIERKSEKLLNFFERVTAIEVTVDFEGGRVTVEIKVDAEHKHDFVARDTGEEPGPTFDRVLSKMEQQIRKYKEKLTDHRRDPSLAQLAEPPLDDAEEE